MIPGGPTVSCSRGAERGYDGKPSVAHSSQASSAVKVFNSSSAFTLGLGKGVDDPRLVAIGRLPEQFEANAVRVGEIKRVFLSRRMLNELAVNSTLSEARVQPCRRLG